MILTRLIYVLHFTGRVLALATASNSEYGDPQKQDVKNEDLISPSLSRETKSLDSESYQDVMTRVISFVGNQSLYNMHVLPHKANVKPGKKTNRTNVDIWANVLYIGDITQDMDFTLDMFLSQQWVDARLEDLLPESVPELVICGNLVNKFWLPLTIVRNSKKTRVHDAPSINSVLKLYRNGTVNYKIRIETTCWCTLDLSSYPFDNQTCQVIFEQFGHQSRNVKFQEQPNRARLMFAPQCSYPTKFKLLSNLTSYDSSCFKYDYEYRYSIFKIEFRFIRHVGPIIIQSHIPACLIVVVSWLGFYIRRNSRFGLGVILVLALSTLSFSSGRRADNFGSITAKDIYMFSCFLFVFLSLVEFGLVQFVGNRYRSRQRDAARARSAASGQTDTGRRKKRLSFQRRDVSSTEYVDMVDPGSYKALSVNLDPSDDDSSPLSGSFLTTSYSAQNTDNVSSMLTGMASFNDDTPTTRKMDCVFRCVLPLLFILFNAIYWGCYLNRYNAVLHEN